LYFKTPRWTPICPWRKIYSCIAIDYVLELVDLTAWRKAPIKSLSGGMKRRAEIARGLVHYPKVLFLDEPTTGLDPQTRANIWDYIHALQKEKGMTIFLTTHYMDEAEICDTVAIIDHGTIVAFDPPHRLKKRFTTDTVKIRTAEGEALAGFLAGRSIPYQLHEGLFTIRSRNVSEALELASRFRSSITDLEIHKGTLNEVFIAVTGKEIRH
jgi:ABC-2 type transport system ATP-binding protein